MQAHGAERHSCVTIKMCVALLKSPGSDENIATTLECAITEKPIANSDEIPERPYRSLATYQQIESKDSRDIISSCSQWHQARHQLEG